MSGNRPTIWVVQLGELEEPISYSIVNKGKPKVFAPQPISNKLVSKSETPIIPFKSGKIISLDDPCTVKSFASIDLDQWLRVVLAEVDAILAPNYIAPAQILRYKTQVDSMQKVLDAKKALASALKTLMIPIYNDEIATKDEIDAIQEVFEQRMLSRVNEFYQVKAGIQFEAKVNSAIKKLPAQSRSPDSMET